MSTILFLMAQQPRKFAPAKNVLTCGRETTCFSFNHDTDYRESGFLSFPQPLQVNVCRVPYIQPQRHPSTSSPIQYLLPSNHFDSVSIFRFYVSLINWSTYNWTSTMNFFVYVPVFFGTLSSRFPKFVPHETSTSIATTFCTYVNCPEK